MSWIESLAGRAENFLNLVDQAAGQALQVEPDPSPAPLPWGDAHQMNGGDERACPLPRYVAPQQLYGHYERPRSVPHQPPAYNLAVSGLEPASLTDAGIDPAALLIAGRNAFGHPGVRRRLAEQYGVSSAQVMVASGTSGANFLLVAIDGGAIEMAIADLGRANYGVGNLGCAVVVGTKRAQSH